MCPALGVSTIEDFVELHRLVVVSLLSHSDEFQLSRTVVAGV